MNKSLLKSLIAILFQYRYRVLLACFLVLMSNGLLIINPLIFRHAIVSINSSSSSPLAWAILLLLIAIFASFFKYAMRIIFFAISREVEMELRQKLFAKIQTQSKKFFDSHGIGDLLSRLSNDITAYRDILGPGLMYPLYFFSLVVPALLALFYLSPILATISIFPIVVIYFINLWVSRPLLKVSHAVQTSLAEMSKISHEHYSGIKLIKSYGIQYPMLLIFKKICSCFSQLNLRMVTIQGLFVPLLALVTKISLLAIILTAGGLILKNWGPSIQPADLFSFIWILSYVFAPLLMLAWVIPMYQRGKAAYERLVEIYNEPNEIETDPHPLRHIGYKSDIEFKDLTFRYPGKDRNVLSNINLTIKGGSFVGITGPVGGGKSTLFKLLSREYEIPHGTLFIGGKDIHQYSLDAFHKELVSVEQLPFLFSRSIQENIRFGKQDADRIEVEEAAQQANLHEDVLGFPLSYETLIGERGVALSGGQRQRVAIARAFLVNRSILLLDDVFSAVDANTEKKIFESIKRKYHGKTVLLITHRVSILEQLERVIYIAEGQVKEDGHPHELVNKKGYYSALTDLQKIQVSL